jgi:hypothetical protein
MYPMHEMQLNRLTACRSDLMDNGIDVSRMDPEELSAFVKEQLDYFQMMLGCDAPSAEIVRRLGRLPSTDNPGSARKGAARLHRPPPGDASYFDKARRRAMIQPHCASPTAGLLDEHPRAAAQ